ncbi:MAG: hypothetical protein ABR538_03535 [Candidatus Binatia bacterium]
MKLESQPDWGVGLVVRDLPLHWELFFDHGGERKFVKSLATGLVPVTISPAELTALELKAFGRHARADARAKQAAKALRPARAAVERFASFPEQLAFFEKTFPGGFEGDTFVEQERGIAGAPGKNGRRETALALAQRDLSLERFENGDPEDLFESARKLLQATAIVFPMEGAIPFAGMDAANRTVALDALRNLLHGDGDYGDRLQAFAGAVKLQDKKGEAKSVTWPFATVFGAFVHPDRFVCVKPTAFASQAATLGLKVEKAQPVTAAGYLQFADVASRTRTLLEEAGQKPRDLVDVYSFIWRTHHDKPA